MLETLIKENKGVDCVFVRTCSSVLVKNLVLCQFYSLRINSLVAILEFEVVLEHLRFP